jgi:class 3 adenylate cyclase/tetratricopeptide (TPR) repeat protein
MQQIVDWLEKLGMSEYAERFAEERIEIDVLAELTDQDLERLRIPLGHRRRMLRAIRELSGPTSATPQATPAASPPAQNHAERRQLTVMFCDLVGSTALSARLDAEDLRGIIAAYHRCCTDLIERNGGFVAKYVGDGVLAYFGYPQAHEHDAERAIRAGLALVEAIPKLATTAGSPLQVRIGIATGLVVVGDLIGAGAAQEQAVVGETPNLAARLQALATPGAVVIAASTHKLTGGLFEYRDLGAVALKGLGENVPAWLVLGIGAAESRFEALRTATTPLIGRSEEIELLLRRWEQAKNGDGQVVLISGEPGIGKSRIAQTILERLSNEPYTRLRYFCSPHHQDSALYPSITQLERAAGFRREDTDQLRLDKLEAVLAQGTNDLSDAVPLLAGLLSIPTGDRYLPLNLTPQKRKEKTLLAQLAQVEGLAARQPVLMVFEDVHWSDPTTRESLDLLIDRVPALRVLVIITFRPEFTPPWIGRPHLTLLSLSRLPPRQRAEMIKHVTRGKVLPTEIADQIMDRTDGVPLFIEELTKTIVESGMLTEAGDRYAITGPVPPLAIPMTLHTSLLARLDRLAPTREVAQIGAALGRRFSHELISAVATMPKQQLDDALAQLVDAQLIFRRGTPPDAEYTFKHALVQDAVYSTLLRSRRQQIHAKIVNALETRFPDVVRGGAGVLARHCAEAGMGDKAVAYTLKAGQQAIARCAMTEAVVQLKKGLDLLSGLPDDVARQEHELSLQITLGQALLATRGYSAPEPGDAFARARYLCEQLNWPPQFGSILRGQFVFRLVRGELEQAEHHAEEIRQLGETRNDVMWKCFGFMFSGNICCWLAKFGDARAHYEEALSLWDPMYRAVSATPEDPYIGSLCHISRTLLCLGYVDQARSRTNEALAKGRVISPYNLVFASVNAWCGIDWATAGEKSAETLLHSVDELLAISSEQGFPIWLPIGKIMRGWCLGALGQAAEGVRLLIQRINMAHTAGFNLLMPLHLTALAQTYERARQPHEGLNRLAEAVKMIETTQERWAEAEIHRVRGTLLLSINGLAAAEDSYRHALAVARRQSAKFWELRAGLDLARLWRDQGKRGEARDLLAPIYNWFTEGFDTPVLQDAKALLDQLA